MSKKVVAIIPARGGSKGIPRKNIKLLAGKPMIAYCIEAALAAGVDRVIVSTEDAEIAEVAQKYGAEVPWLRPLELAADDVPTLPVLQHALEELQKEAYVPDYVLLMYPTSPLLTTQRIREAVALAEATNAGSIVSGTYDKGHYWNEDGGVWKRFFPLNLANRQQSKPLFKENGAIYLSKPGVLANQVVADTVMPLIMEPGETIDVDEPADFAAVEKILLAN